jgi:CDP-paratose 2-epimerase
VLFVEDLVDAMMYAHERMESVRGHAFNIGGGPSSTTSLLELIDRLGDLLGTRPAYRIEPWRTADQRYYVSDTGKFHAATGWRPRVTIEQGLKRLASWLADSGAVAHTSLAGGRVAS